MDNKSKLKVINWFILSPLFLRCCVVFVVLVFDEISLIYFLFRGIFMSSSSSYVNCPFVCIFALKKPSIVRETRVSCRVFSPFSRWKLSSVVLTIFCISIRFRIYYASLKTLKWYLNEFKSKWDGEIWNFLYLVCVFVCNDDRLLRILWMFLWRTVKWKCP